MHVPLETACILLGGVALVLVYELTHFDHHVLHAEVGVSQVEIQTALQLTHDARATYASHHIPLAQAADGRVVVRGVEDLCLLFDGQLTEHLVQLVVKFYVLLPVFNQLLREEPVQVLGHLGVYFVPLVNCQLT